MSSRRLWHSRPHLGLTASYFWSQKYWNHGSGRHLFLLQVCVVHWRHAVVSVPWCLLQKVLKNLNSFHVGGLLGWALQNTQHPGYWFKKLFLFLFWFFKWLGPASSSELEKDGLNQCWFVCRTEELPLKIFFFNSCFLCTEKGEYLCFKKLQCLSLIFYDAWCTMFTENNYLSGEPKPLNYVTICIISASANIQSQRAKTYIHSALVKVAGAWCEFKWTSEL